MISSARNLRDYDGSPQLSMLLFMDDEKIAAPSG